MAWWKTTTCTLAPTDLESRSQKPQASTVLPNENSNDLIQILRINDISLIVCFTEKEDEIIKRNNEDKDDKNEEYQNLIDSKGLEEVLRRKEFLFNIKIDRSQYIVKDENSEKMVVENDDDKDKENQMKEEDNKENNKDEGVKEKDTNEKDIKDNNEKIEIKE